MSWWSHLSRTETALAPSILGGDLARVAEEVADVEVAGVDLLHLDVMDGHFVPQLTFGPQFCAAIASVAMRPLDCHLMIESPGAVLAEYYEAGCHGISFHLEAVDDPLPLLEEIRRMGAKAGLALNPETPLPKPGPLWDQLDLLLVMSVNPGACGRPFQTEVLPKISAARSLRIERGLDFAISVDGGINPDNAPLAVKAGADILVAASAIMGRPSRAEAVASFRRALEQTEAS